MAPAKPKRAISKHWKLLQELSRDGQPWGKQDIELSEPKQVRDVELMSESNRARLELYMRDALYMVRVAKVQLADASASGVVTGAIRSTYLRWFGTEDHVRSVHFMLEAVEGFIEAFLRRRAPKVSYDEGDRMTELAILKLDGAVGSYVSNNDALDPDDVDHSVLAYAKSWPAGHSRITLFPSFWTHANGLEDFHALRLEPEEDREDLAFDSPALSLLHEFMHVVSYYCVHNFLAASALDPDEVMEWFDLQLIGDIDLLDIATEDETETLSKAHPDGDTESYGVEGSQELVRLENGPLGALMNADSYRYFIAQVAFEYLGGLFEDTYANDEEAKIATAEWARLIAEQGEETEAQIRAARPESWPHKTVQLSTALRESLSKESQDWHERILAETRQLVTQPPSKDVKLVKQWWREPECQAEIPMWHVRQESESEDSDSESSGRSAGT